MTWAVYLLLGVAPIMVFAFPGLASRVTGQPAVHDFLPYFPVAALALVGYLGSKIRQSRVVLAALLLLVACVMFRHPDVLLPPVFDVLALALPLSLALVFVFPDGPLMDSYWPWRALAILAPFAVLGGMVQWGPDAFTRLTAIRLPIPPGFCRCPHLAPVFALPLALVAFLRWNRRIRWFILALLPALVPFWLSVHANLAAWWKPVTAIHVGIALSALSLILLHAILHVFWRRVYLDELTDLYNRRALDEDLARMAGPFTLAMIDVDRFKEFNDRYGHAEGDHVLRMIAVRLRADLGPRTYRYGGEEFCALFDGADGAAAARRLDVARRRIEEHAFGLRTHTPRVRSDRGALPPAEPQIAVTISSGIAVSGPKDSAPAQVVRRADDALYRAKAQGRNRVVLAD